jgi:hypothetical protein
MTQTELLVAAAAFGRGWYQRRTFRRLARSLALVVVLMLMTTAVAGVLLLEGAYAAYVAALHYGMASPVALMTMAVLGVIAIGMLIAVIRMVLRRMVRQHEFPITTQISEIVDAFLNGLSGGNI